MPIIKSAKKALRQTKRRSDHNEQLRKKLNRSLKSLKKALNASDKKKSQALVSDIFSQLDKAEKRQIIHRNKAARKKSQLARKIAQL